MRLYLSGRERSEREFNAKTQRLRGGVNNKSRTTAMCHPALSVGDGLCVGRSRAMLPTQDGEGALRKACEGEQGRVTRHCTESDLETMSRFGGYEDQPFVAEFYDFEPIYAARPDVEFYVDFARSAGGKRERLVQAFPFRYFFRHEVERY